MRSFDGLALRLIDTAGFEDAASRQPSPHRMTGQTLAAIAEADAILFVIDARAGVTAGDEIIAQALRKSRQASDPGRQQMRRPDRAAGGSLWPGLSANRIELSAEHALGMEEMAEALAPLAPRADAGGGRRRRETVRRGRGNRRDAPVSTISTGRSRLALVGRPNVGKSSLFNQLAGRGPRAYRAGSGADPRRHRRAVESRGRRREVLLHDTAGLRKKARVAGETLEEMSVASTLEAIRFADCVIVMIDATAPFEKQDLAIADLIAREGRAIVFAVNKWDLLENKAGAISRMREKLDRLLPQVAGAPLVAISAKTGEGIDRLAAAVIDRRPGLEHAHSHRRR